MSVVEQLTVTWPRTDFFTAVCLLERLTPGHPRIGEDGPHEREALTFRHDPSFAFRPNEISKIDVATSAPAPEDRLRGKQLRYEVTTCILGLTGADSPLPLYHAEDLMLDQEEFVVQRHFLDIFHNRITAFLFRAIAKHHFPLEFLRGGRDLLSTRLLALAGVDTYGAPDTPLARTEHLQITALVALGGSTSRSLQNALRELLSAALDGSDLQLEQYTGGWVTFDPSQRNELGKENSCIGDSFVLGTRALHPAQRARVVIGPISPNLARQFSPGGPHYNRVCRLLPALCSEPISFELELLVNEDAFPRFLVGAKAPAGLGDGIMLSAKKPQKRIARYLFDLDKSAHGS